MAAPSKRLTTCQAAAEHGRQVGARIFWRPGGVVNWSLPDYDAAEILDESDGVLALADRGPRGV
jgi:hypothetical protein